MVSFKMCKIVLLYKDKQKLWFFILKKILQNEETRKEMIFIAFKFVSQ